MIRRNIALGAICGALLLAAAAHAGIDGFLLGTDAPPRMIGGVAFTPFAPDTQPLPPVSGFGDIKSVAVNGSSPPLEPSIGFSSPLVHLIAGVNWTNWSHDYGGDVYASVSPMTMSMPAGTRGFYFYAEPALFEHYPFTVTAMTDAHSTALLTDLIHGDHGAKGFAFVAGPGESLVSVTVRTTTASFGYAIGEFGIAMVPAPATLALFGLASVGRRRRG